METVRRDGSDFRRQRSAGMTEIAIALPFVIALWLGVYYFLPPIAGMVDTLARLVFALKCCCVAILLCFVTGIEAVAHERLQSPAFDPLAGYETRRLRINLRYLQNTLEQLLLFIPGLLALSVYGADGRSMRAVVAITLVWIATRFAFWIGYHYGPKHRGVGAPGMMQSMLVLLYVCGRFGYDIGGIAGAAAPFILFGCIEAWLVYATRSPIW
jgi:MAPEG family